MQIIGFITILASLVCSIAAIVNGTPKTLGIVLLVIGASLIKIGRTIYNNNRKT